MAKCRAHGVNKEVPQRPYSAAEQRMVFLKYTL